MEKIRVAVVGAGTYGKVLINAYYGQHKNDKIDFVAVADVSQDALNFINEKYQIKGYLNYIEMFEAENIDAVAIVTPDYLHKEVLLAAAEKKIHILAQKPLSTDTAEGNEMIKAANDNDVMLYVDFHKRFDPGHIQLRNAIKAGKLGEIEYGYACMEDKILVPTEWFKGWAHNSSPAWFIGVHFFDLIYWLLGEKPHRVYASGSKKKLKSMGIDTYDSLQSKFEFPSGATITVDSSWILPNSFSSIVNQQIRLVGTEGFQEVDSQDRGIVAAYNTDTYSHVVNPTGMLLIDDPLAGPIPTGYTIDSMTYFLDLVKRIKYHGAKVSDLKPLYPTGEEALVSTIMSQCAHESARIGEIVEIKY